MIDKQFLRWFGWGLFVMTLITLIILKINVTNPLIEEKKERELFLEQKEQIERTRLIKWVYDTSPCVSWPIAAEIVDSARQTSQPLFLLSLIAAESHPKFNPYSISSKGAIGLGQIMPVHIKELVAQKLIIDKRQLYDIESNIQATGYIFLKEYVKAKYDLRKALKQYLNEDRYDYYSEIMNNYFYLQTVVMVANEPEPIIINEKEWEKKNVKKADK